MNAKDSLIPQELIPAGADEFSKTVHGLLDGQPKDEATVSKALEGMDEMLDVIAARLYSMASMLVGEGEESIELVETAVARTDISACSDATEARRSSRRALCTAAIELIAKRKPGSLAAPEGLVTPRRALKMTIWSRLEFLVLNWRTCWLVRIGQASRTGSKACRRRRA